MAFSMDVTDALEVPKTEEIELEVKKLAEPTPEVGVKLKKSASANVEKILDVDLTDLLGRREITGSIAEFGMDTMTKSGEKNQMLARSVGDLSKSGSEGGQVSKTLIDLQREVKELDPSGLDFTRKGVLGKLLNPIHGYFDKYEKSDKVIASIVESLDKGKSMLKNDNTTLEIEETALRDLTKKLTAEIELGMNMDEEIAARLDVQKSQNADPDKIRFIEEEIQFPLRQRIEDMQQLVVVNHQGIIAMEVIRRNNRELMRGVDRAKNVTLSALRTAIMVASALYNQKIVLQKLQALDQTTNNMIASTSKMLKEQGAEIHKQTLESGVSPDTLKTAFEDVMSALDDISSFKQSALPVMKERITVFRELADKGEKEIAKLAAADEKRKLLEAENGAGNLIK